MLFIYHSAVTWAQLFEGRLALNPGFFFLCLKAFSRLIFCAIFRAPNHQLLDKKELKVKCFLRANVCNFRESVDSREFLHFFIFCSNNLYRTHIFKKSYLNL